MHSITYIHFEILIFGIHVKQVKTLCHMQEWLLLFWPFELSPLIEFYRGQLVRFITFIFFEIFGCYFIDILHVSDQDGVSSLRVIAPPCCTFELSPLNLL